MLGSYRRFVLLLCLGLQLGLGASVSALAQTSNEPAPILAVSIAPLDKVFGEVDLIGATAGFPEATKALRADLGAKYGVDGSKPIGFWLTAQKETPENIEMGLFLTVTDPKKFEEAMGNLGYKAAAEQGGVKQFTPALPFSPPIHGKLVGSTFYISGAAEALAKLPRDPVALLGDLPTKYTVGVRFQTKTAAPQTIAKIKGAFTTAASSAAMMPIPGGDPTGQVKQATAQLAALAKLVEEIDTIEGGLKLDPSTKAVRAEWSQIAKPGTSLAQLAAAQSSLKSAVGGVFAIGNVFQMQQVAVVPPAGQEQFRAFSQNIRQQIETGLEKISGPGANAGARKQFAEGVAALIDETIAKGTLDIAAAGRIEEKNLTLAAAISLADGAKLATLLKDYAAAEKSNPEFPEVLFDYATHQNIAIHYAKVPTPEQGNLKKAFGDEIDIAIGTGEKTAWVVVGAGAIDWLKKAADESVAAAGKPVEKSQQMKIVAAPILRFLGAIEPSEKNIKAVGEVAGRFTGNAVIELNEKSTPTGSQGDFTVSEDVFKLFREVMEELKKSNAPAAAGT